MAHVWEKSYPPGVRWDTPLPPAAPLESLLETAATSWSDRIAIDFYDRNRMRDRSRLHARSGQVDHRYIRGDIERAGVVVSAGLR
jgi:hypothetical protein